MTVSATRPLAVSCGDPSGIGPEVISGAWQDLGGDVPFFAIGDPRHFKTHCAIQVIETPNDCVNATDLPVLEYEFALEAVPGHPAPENAAGVVAVLERAVDMCLRGDVAGLVTAPIAKKELKDHANFRHPGHTEFLAALTGADHAVMMIASEALRVVPATIHIPLADVPAALNAADLTRTIRVTHDALIQDFGIPAPRIAVSGLNPHAGEDGLMGTEELTLIRPVCDRLRAEGLDVSGPLPADTMFHPAARARFDAAIAMYHDQALVPAKTLAFDTGVNVTLGLPIIRTSPDHGTAFDIAGKGLANPNSMIEAIRLAGAMAKARVS